MNPTHKTYFNWSSGKDAALAFYHLQQDPTYQIDRLITTVNAHYQRVSMHGLPIQLLNRQAAAIGLPLSTIQLPEQPTMERYEQILGDTLRELQQQGYTHSGFGDIFLEDLRQYRENQLQDYGMIGTFPLWKRDTKALVRELVDLGFKAVIICLKSDLLDVSFLGRAIDQQLIDDLPANVDPCGENGEFHTFCYDGPIFQAPIAFTFGERVFREYEAPKENNEQTTTLEKYGFWFLDLIPT
ncbi:MAG: ATP-binding protein [Bacteroidota bacterium]